MPTYLYEVIETGEEIEVEQKISASPLTELEHNGAVVKVRRLICGQSAFHLKGGCWAKDGYDHRIQKGDK